jgi:hypothetical protein
VGDQYGIMPVFNLKWLNVGEGDKKKGEHRKRKKM